MLKTQRGIVLSTRCSDWVDKKRGKEFSTVEKPMHITFKIMCMGLIIAEVLLISLRFGADIFSE